MNNKLLYFPYIDIPRNSWTVKSLLYWDKVGIIVPPDYAENPKQYNKETIELLKTDLIEQIFPYNYIYKVRKFDKGFLKLVNQPKFNLTKRQEDFYKGKISRIHVQKFGEDIFNKLIELKIAKRKRNDWQWYYVERRTAKLIMLYLATVIGKSGNFTPATDNLKNLDLSINQNGKILRRNSIRENILEDLIPYPIKPDLTKLRRFKDKYHHELKSFRILLEQVILTISSLNNNEIRSDYQTLKIAEINDKKEKILSELKQSKFGQITFGTMFGLVGSVYGFSQGNDLLGGFSLGNAIYSAFQGYGNSSIRSQDYSYLALIDKKLK